MTGRPAIGAMTAATLPQLLLEQAQRRPSAVCQRKKDRGLWRRYTWAEVLEHVRDFALGLEALGLAPGETVAVVGENDPQHFWAEIAAQAMGGKVISLYPDLTPDEMHYLLTDAGAVHLVAEDQEQVDKALAIVDRLPDLRSVIYWDARGLWSYRHPVLRSFTDVEAVGRARADRDPEGFLAAVAAGKATDVAVISYTSGTTGRPKGAITTHAFLLDNAQRVLDALPIRAGAEYLSYISPAWMTEQLIGITLGLMVPLTVNFPEEPEEVLPNIRELAVEMIVFSPRQWESLASLVQARMLDAGRVRRTCYRAGIAVGGRVNVARLEGRRRSLVARALYPLADALVLKPLRDKLGLTRARLALCGGSAMAPDVFRLFHAMGVPLRNVYGTSEIGLLTTHQGETYDLETVGHWMSADPRWGPPLEWKVSEAGELLVKGGTGFAGYWGKPEKTAERWDGEWFRTGDAVSVTAAGELVFLERLDDMRRLVSGHTFPPQFIETRLRFSPFIKDVMIVGDRTRDRVTALVNVDGEVVGRWAEERRIAFSTFTDLSQKPAVVALVRDELRRVNALLPEHARVARFVNLPKDLDPDEGELTRTRKLRREFLEERYRPLIEAMYADAEHVDAEIPVRYQDGRRGVLRASVAVTTVPAA
jgi:long-chain acyl-CoA synthetase